MPETLIQPPELATAPEAATPPPSDDGFDMSKLETDGAEKPAAKPEATKAPEAKPAAPAASKPEVKHEAAKVEAKPAAAAPEAAKPAAPLENPDKPKSLGQLFRDEQKRTKELQSKLELAEGRMKELESKPSTPADDPEKKKLTTRLEELESEIRYVNYEKSSEFRDKYQQPYLKKSQELTKEAGELVVDRPDGTFSAVSTQEFWDVVTAPTLNDAVKAARELFPDDPTKANQVLGMRKEIKASWDTMQQAKEEYRTKGAEREKQTQLQEQQKRAQVETETAAKQSEREKKWQEMNEAALQSPQLEKYFKAAEDDPKGKELLTKGENYAKLAFGIGARDDAGNLLNEDGKPIPEDQLITYHSGLYRKASAFNYVAYKRDKFESQVAELEKELAQYRGSQPTPGAPKGDKTPDAEGGSLEDQLEQFVNS